MPISANLLLPALLAGLSAMVTGQQGHASANPVPAPVEISYCGLRPGKPPLSYLSFNVTVRNPADVPQWFLFPAALYDKPAAGRKGAGIDAIELFSDSQHQATVVWFMGTMKLQPEGAGGFKGLLLPPGAVISVHGFGISFWGEPVSPLPMKVVMADEVTIGGTPVEQWIGKPLLSAKTADVKDLDHAGSKSAEDLKELPVEIRKSGEITIPDALARSCTAQPAP
jgi:hypothetical protein